MRPDVKLGVVISLVVVLVAGGYYLYRDSREVPISVSDNTLTASKLANGAAAPTMADAQREALRSRSPGAAEPIRGTAPEKRRADRPRTQSTSKTAAGRPSTSTPQNPSRVADRRADQPSVSVPSRGPGGGSQPQVRPGSRRVEGTPKRSTRQAAAGSDSSTENPSRVGVREQVADAGPVPSGSTSAPGSAGRQGLARRATKAANASREGARDPRATPGGSQIASGVPDARGRKLEGRRRPEAVETHRVQPGDTLASLARSYYGHEKYTSFLVEHNPKIPDPNRLRVGMSVRIPPAPSDRGLPAATSHPPRTASVLRESAKPRTYTAKPGDSFYGIARAVLGEAARWEELFDLNKDRVHGDPKRLQVGQVLILPD